MRIKRVFELIPNDFSQYTVNDSQGSMATCQAENEQITSCTRADNREHVVHCNVTQCLGQ